MIIESKKKIMERLENSKSKDFTKKEKGRLIVNLLLSLSENINPDAQNDTGKFLIAIRKGLLEETEQIVVNRSGSNPILVIGHEDYEYDYDPVYIDRTRIKVKNFIRETGICVECVRSSEEHDLYSSNGPYHVVRLKEILTELRNLLGENEKASLLATEQKTEMIIAEIAKAKEDEKDQEQKAKLAFIKEEVKKRTSLEISDQLAVMIQRLRLFNQQDLDFSHIDNLLVISQFAWETFTTSSTVTDYAVRQVSIINIVELKKIGSSYDRELFRTTGSGVCGKRYEIGIKAVVLEDKVVKVVFRDDSLSLVKL